MEHYTDYGDLMIARNDGGALKVDLESAIANADKINTDFKARTVKIKLTGNVAYDLTRSLESAKQEISRRERYIKRLKSLEYVQRLRNDYLSAQSVVDTSTNETDIQSARGQQLAITAKLEKLPETIEKAIAYKRIAQEVRDDVLRRIVAYTAQSDFEKAAKERQQSELDQRFNDALKVLQGTKVQSEQVAKVA